MDSGGDRSKENKRKSPMDPKEIKIPFRVFCHQAEAYTKFSLKLAKPDNPNWDKTLVPSNRYPRVSRERVSVEDQHALYIMHNLNHRNVVSMKAVGRSKLQKGNELSAFIEECTGVLGLSFWPVLAGPFQHIPSPTFQTIMREIFDGVDFLWRNKKYHGNLSWETTLCQSGYTVKLNNFKWKDLSLEQAQCEDWESIIVMLEIVLNTAIQENADPQKQQKLFCGEINALIDMMRTSDRKSLLGMKDAVFEEDFFWTSDRRVRFIMITVSEFLHDEEFIKEVDKSDLCSLPWNSKDSTIQYLNRVFEALLKHCNDYRDGLTPPVPHFNPTKQMDCVHLVYAAYTHRNQIQVVVKASVDYIVRGKFPKLFLGLNCIIRNLRTSKTRRAL